MPPLRPKRRCAPDLNLVWKQNVPDSALLASFRILGNMFHGAKRPGPVMTPPAVSVPLPDPHDGFAHPKILTCPRCPLGPWHHTWKIRRTSSSSGTGTWLTRDRPRKVILQVDGSNVLMMFATCKGSPHIHVAHPYNYVENPCLELSV